MLVTKYCTARLKSPKRCDGIQLQEIETRVRTHANTCRLKRILVVPFFQRDLLASVTQCARCVKLAVPVAQTEEAQWRGCDLLLGDTLRIRLGVCAAALAYCISF